MYLKDRENTSERNINTRDEINLKVVYARGGG